MHRLRHQNFRLIFFVFFLSFAVELIFALKIFRIQDDLFKYFVCEARDI